MLDPQRAVLVESRDALGERYEVRACGVGGRMDEFDDRVLGGSRVPRGQGIAFRVRGPGGAERSRSAEHKRRKFAPPQFHREPRTPGFSERDAHSAEVDREAEADLTSVK